MPLKYSGTKEDRLRRLEHFGTRCDAENRQCIQTAVLKFTLLPADGHFNPLPDAAEVIKQACSKHRPRFGDSGVWKVVDVKPIPKRVIKPGGK